VKNLLASYSGLRFFAEFILSVVEGLRMTPKKRNLCPCRVYIVDTNLFEYAYVVPKGPVYFEIHQKASDFLLPLLQNPQVKIAMSSYQVGEIRVSPACVTLGLPCLGAYPKKPE